MTSYAYTLVTAPASLAISDSDMEAHARAQGQPAEQYQPYIAAAQAYTEMITGRKLISQTWKWFLDDWPCGDRMDVPFGQLSSVTHIKYTDSADAQTTWATTYWTSSTARDPGVIALKYGQSWPSATLRPLDPIEIQFVCGWATPGDVPADLRAAALLFAAHLYEHRESVILGDQSSVESKALEMGFNSLVANWRLY